MSRTMSPFLDGKSTSVVKESLSTEKPAPQAPTVIIQRRPQAISLPFQTGSTSSIFGETGGAKWPRGLSNSGRGVLIDVNETLQNGRMAYHYSPHARVMIKRGTDLTVDRGLKLEPTPDWKSLGIEDEEFQEDWTSSHESRFDMLMKSKQIDREGKDTGYQLQRFGYMCSTRDNDQYIRIHYNRSPNRVSPVQIQFIDPTQIRGNACVDSYGQQFSGTNGIEYNEQGEEVAYLINSREIQKNGVSKWKQIRVPARGKRSGRIFMLHWFTKEYTGQGRGYSPLHFCVQELENILDFQSAQTKLAINQSGFVGHVVPSKDAPASNPMEILQGGNDFQDDQVITVSIDEERQQYTLTNLRELNDRSPGSNFYTNLGPGEDIKFPQQTAPNTQFDKFVTSIFSYLSAARGWPLEVLVMAFNSNYSASRAALLEAWRTAGIEQDDIKADMMDTIYEMWLSEEIAAGRSFCPGWQDPRLRQAWLQYVLQGPPLPSISPRDDSAANETDLKLALTTQDRLSRAKNGSRAAQNIRINKKMFDESPLPFWEVKQQTETVTKPGESSSDNNE